MIQYFFFKSAYSQYYVLLLRFPINQDFFRLVLFQAILFIRQARQNKSLVGEIFTYRNRSPCKQGPYNVFQSSLTPLVHIQMSDGQMILEPQTWCPECQKRKVRNFLVKSNNSTMILIDMFPLKSFFFR